MAGSVAASSMEGAVGFGQRAQPLDRAGQGELGAAEALDEVAAAGGAEQLEVAELGVEGREAAGDALGEHGLAGDDAVALEHQLGLGAQPRPRAGRVLEERRGQRPAALDRGAGGRAAAGEAAAAGARAAGTARRRGARSGAKASLVTSPRPGEVPERVVELLGREVEVGEQVEPEGRARRRGARGSRRGARPRRARAWRWPGGGPARRTSSRK